MASFFALLIAAVILLLAIGMKIIAKTSDSRIIFQLAVLVFIALYVLAAVAISWLNPGLPGANFSSFSSLVQPTTKSETLPAAPQDTVIRQ